MILGQTIRKIRKEKFPDVTQAEFAQRAGITQTYLSLIEKDRKTPHVSTLQNISECLGVPLTVIMWLSTEEKDVAEDKKKAFNFLKPSIDTFINEFLN